MKILLVEDDLLLAKGTAKLIERLSPHQVQITTDPDKIFKWCRSGEIDLVLMDINLPGSQWNGKLVSGTDLARSLKEDSHTNWITIILLSAYAMANQKKALLELSKADDFFTKPITNYNQFIQHIEELAMSSHSPG